MNHYPLSALRWIARERERVESGEYGALPASWNDAAWYRESALRVPHCAHVSVDDPTKLAYTPDHRKGEADRQVSMKPGRYLARYFSDVLSPERIRDLATEWAAHAETYSVRFAREPDDIERVYREGPRSCMAYDRVATCTRAYGAGDLAIAYLEVNGRVTARAVCWPDKRVYARPYGDATRLEAALPSDWKRSERESVWHGAKLLKLEARNGRGFYLPYLDIAQGVTDCGDHWEVGGDIAYDTDGIARDGSITCDDCGYAMSEDESYPSPDGSVCESCYSDNYFCCERCEEARPIEGSREVDGDAIWCSACVDYDAEECAACEKYHSETTEVDGDEYCADCVPDSEECAECEDRVTEWTEVHYTAEEAARRVARIPKGLGESVYACRVEAAVGPAILCGCCEGETAACEGCERTILGMSEATYIEGGRVLYRYSPLCPDCGEPGTSTYQTALERQGQATLAL